MPSKVKLTKRSEFVTIYKHGKSWGSSLLVIKALANESGQSRYGFSVSKSVGKAVTRNRVKRLLREIVRLMTIKPGWDLVFIARPAAASANYHELGEAVKELLARARLLDNNA